MMLLEESSHHQSIADLPGPSGVPLLGNLLQLDWKQLHLQLEAWSRQYGPMYKIKLANQLIPVIADPLLIHEVLRKRPKLFRQPRSFSNALNEEGMGGLFSAEGKDWQRQRQLLNVAFSKKALENYFPSVQRLAIELVKRLESEAQRNDSIDMLVVFKKFTTDITVNIVFGCKAEDLGDAAEGFDQSLDLVFAMITKRSLFPIPYWRLFLLPKDKQHEKAMRHVKAVTKIVIEKASEQLILNPALKNSPESILQAMLIAADEENGSLTNDELVGNVITLFLAGVETSANVLSWCCYYLASNKTVQDAITEEVDLLFADRESLDFSVLDKMPLTESLILETLRLKSVVPTISSESISDNVVGNLFLPKDTKLILLSRFPGLDDQVFSDAQNLKLDRWIGKSKKEKCPHSNKTHFPFGGGSRVCIGEDLSIVEIILSLAWICKNFRLHLSNSEPVKENFHFSMSPSSMVLKLEPRRPLRNPEMIARSGIVESVKVDLVVD